MSRRFESDNQDYATSTSDWKRLSLSGGIAAFILMVYCVGTMAQMVALGGPPASATEAFGLLRESRILGLLRLDLPTVLAMPLYYVLFLALYARLRSVDGPIAILGSMLAFAGLTLFLAAPSGMSIVFLADKHAAATTDVARAQFLAAGEAVLASDIWHGTSPMVGGVLMQVGAVLLCVVMLRGDAFGKLTAWIGIAMYGLDLTHIFAMIWLPTVGVALMAIAGPLYPVWLFLVGKRLVCLSKSSWDATPAGAESPRARV